MCPQAWVNGETLVFEPPHEWMNFIWARLTLFSLSPPTSTLQSPPPFEPPCVVTVKGHEDGCLPIKSRPYSMTLLYHLHQVYRRSPNPSSLDIIVPELFYPSSINSRSNPASLSGFSRARLCPHSSKISDDFTLSATFSICSFTNTPKNLSIELVTTRAAINFSATKQTHSGAPTVMTGMVSFISACDRLNSAFFQAAL